MNIWLIIIIYILLCIAFLRLVQLNFFVCADGSTVVVNRGRLSPKSISKIQRFIRNNFVHMYNIWISNGGRPEFYRQ